MRRTLIIATLLAAVLATAQTDYLVTCEGFNSETSTRVVGTCYQAHFDGNDTATGQKVYGDCAPGGELNGYESATGIAVYGECEGL